MRYAKLATITVAMGALLLTGMAVGGEDELAIFKRQAQFESWPEKSGSVRAAGRLSREEIRFLENSVEIVVSPAPVPTAAFPGVLTGRTTDTTSLSAR